MRSSILSIVTLSAVVVILSIPAPAAAWSNFIIFLAQQACSGQSAAYKNGCYAYLEKRVLQCSNPDTSLSNGNTRCDSWYSTNPANKSICIQGAQFLRGKE